ncbi:MAG: undecaprenyl-diphosphate phosphatase [Pirellulaceae bacterium]|nr:undecaprenyl-diphosphate phosphatase [Pirellulaceae bacterium]
MTAFLAFAPWQVVVLAIVQGIAEFLPISSSGHLVVLAPLLFGQRTAPEGMTDLSIVLHLGTLGSILVYYRQRIARLFAEDRRTLGLLIVGTLPAVVVGLPLKLWLEPVLESPLVAGFLFPVTGLAILWAMRRPEGTTEYRDLSWSRALLIGTAQAAAILPGLSRSGSTISAGLGVGLSRSAAATFSFLLAIVAICGAGVLEGIDLAKADSPRLATSPGLLAVGAAISFVVGLGALALLDRMLQRGQLQWFAWYCFALGAAVIGWQLFGG